MKIINQKDIQIYGNSYKEITYDNGEVALKRYSEQYKTWVTLQFSDKEEIDKIKSITLKCLHW